MAFLAPKTKLLAKGAKFEKETTGFCECNRNHSPLKHRRYKLEISASASNVLLIIVNAFLGLR